MSGDAGGGRRYPDDEDEARLEAARALVAEWRRMGEDESAYPTPFRTGYRAALRKCADELGYELGGEDGPS